MALITCKNLALGYEGKEIVSDLNFKVEEGNYFCIVGENGSGKSTLMKTLLRLQPPIKGEIILGDGLERNQIGYLPQQTVVQRDFPASVKEIVISGCQNRLGFRPFYNRAEKERAHEAMRAMNIDDLQTRCYRDLSGGQQQRVLLARALCATEKIILLDEPVTGLDPVATEDMYQEIEKLNKKGMTIIMISHDIEAAAKYATHILHISEHIFVGTKEDYLQSDIGKKYLSQKDEA